VPRAHARCLCPQATWPDRPPRTVFISYARPDAAIAQALAERLKSNDVEIWVDYDKLGIGMDWAQAIADGLRSCDGIVIIASKRSKRSEWVSREMRFAVQEAVPLLPVVVDDYAFLPPDLAHIQAVLVTRNNFEQSIGNAARSIATWIRGRPHQQIRDSFATALSADLAEEVNKAGDTTTDEARRSVFIVHGHDDVALGEVTAYLREIGVKPIVLREIEEPEDSLLRRFLRIAEQATFAVVVFSPDDIGASLAHFDAPKGGEKALRYRARQNVVLELGFFLGKLKDFNKVLVLRSNPGEPWPEFEMPSDLAGAIFKEIDQQGRWKNLLRSALMKNGVEVR
jgi:predicted nucleotide-binding protein